MILPITASPNPKPKPISFGIYLTTKKTNFGDCIFGKYKGYNIEIYDIKKDNTKLYYVCDNKLKWIQSKLVYYINGIKKIARSNSNGLQR